MSPNLWPRITFKYVHLRASLLAQLVKNCAMGETCLRSVGWEDALEKGKAPVFWPGEFHGLYSPQGNKSQTRLSEFHSICSFEECGTQ